LTFSPNSAEICWKVWDFEIQLVFWWIGISVFTKTTFLNLGLRNSALMNFFGFNGTVVGVSRIKALLQRVWWMAWKDNCTKLHASFQCSTLHFQPIAPFNSITTQILEPCNIHLQFLQSVMCFLSFFFFVRFSRGMLNFYSICLLILYLIWDF